jgi:hypothetical protein
MTEWKEIISSVVVAPGRLALSYVRFWCLLAVVADCSLLRFADGYVLSYGALEFSCVASGHF